MESSYLSLLLLLVFLTLVFTPANGKMRSSRDETRRKAKLFPVFQVVTFPNVGCTSSSSTRNGTCYTAAECTSKGGTASGTCASAYGVCCLFSLSCGGSSSQNNTYLVQASITKAPTSDPCTYTLCRCNSNICRIRLDFTTFTIAPPQNGLATQAGAAPPTNGGGIGDCITDQFTLTSPGNVGSPVICGFNTGQHMIVDASESCTIANFYIGATSDTRQWDIKVTQYACGDEQGGPEGCQQYFTGTSGRVSNFNFPTTATNIGATTTHLSSQCYTICFRQELNRCTICFTTSITNTATTQTETAQTSFGLSVSPAAAANSAVNTGCSTDYLVIPNGEAIPVTGTAAGVERFCGRIFTVIDANTIQASSVCTRTRPFRLTFKSNADETTAAAAAMAQTNEQSGAPGGIVGFSLNFAQLSC